MEPKRVHAPELGQFWLNSPPLSLRALRGRVVLVDFWDYTCIHCIHTLPYVREWHRRYHAHGLVVIGVHTPEFSFARQPAHVERAARQFGLAYPILLDNDRQAWHAFANRAWPTTYLVDAEGYIRYSHSGEGHYRETELAIQELLRELDAGLDFPGPAPFVRALDQPGAHRVCHPASPERHFGAGEAPPQREGPWTERPECLQAAGSARLRLPYDAAEVNAVLAGPARVEILDNGLALDHQSRGEDVREAPDGSTWVEVDWPRLYSLVRRDRFLSRTLELSTPTAGLQLYAFSFDTCLPKNT